MLPGQGKNLMKIHPLMMAPFSPNKPAFIRDPGETPSEDLSVGGQQPWACRIQGRSCLSPVLDRINAVDSHPPEGVGIPYFHHIRNCKPLQCSTSRVIANYLHQGL